MADSLDDMMKDLSFDLFRPVKAGVDDVMLSWELFYGNRSTNQENDQFHNYLIEMNKLEDVHAGIARYILQLGIIQSRKYSANVSASKVLELSASLAGIANRGKMFPFTALEKCAIKSGKKLVLGENIDYIETIINEISYLMN